MSGTRNAVDRRARNDRRFNSINRRASRNFVTFSPKRLFSPVGDNVIDITFSVPGRNAPAAVDGFGAVFVDVDKARTTKLTAYNKDGCVIFEEFVKPSPGGLSFLGVSFGKGNDVIKKVVIELGDAFLNRSGSGNGRRKRDDVVVLDDFAYGEPQRLR